MIKNSLKYLKDSDFKSELNFLRAYREIKKTNLFDEEFYTNAYPDVTGDALAHYLYHGTLECRYPSFNFDSKLYLEMYPDVEELGLNPLIHYILYGIHENRIIKEVPVESRKEEIARTNLTLLNNFEFEEEPLVSIIILNRNGLGHLKRLFKDFKEKTNYSNFEIIVVDNASDDESVSYLKSLDLPITVIENTENVSFSKGNNDAVKIAKGEFVLLLNNDIEPTFGWLNELVGTIMQSDEVAMVGAKLVFPFYFHDPEEKSYTIQHTGDIFAERMKPCCLYAVNKSNKDLDVFDTSLNKITRSIAVTAAATLIRRDIYTEVGGLDEDYIYGLEDVDFCLKLYKKGYLTAYSGTSLLFHHESSTRVISKDYAKNDKHNFEVFINKWGKFLSKEMLLDKIDNKKFLSEKQLKIAIVGQSNEFTSKIAKEFNSRGYEVALHSSPEDNYFGDSTDILLSFNPDFDLDNIIARRDIVKVFAGTKNIKGYNLIIKNSSDNFTDEFLDKVRSCVQNEFKG